MHRLSASFVLGYHGCNREVGESLLAGASFKPSTNDYDWLGHGIYFWEANPKRGLEFVQEMAKLPRFKEKYPNPFVIGAVIELGHCLDLSSQTGIDYVKQSYTEYKKTADFSNQPIAENKGVSRKLDCAVITLLHEIRAQAKMTPIDTVKGIFVEGKPIYPDAGFYDKTHTQICVRNPPCIKGVFRVNPEYLK